MKRAVVLTLLGFVVSFPAHSQTANATEQEILKLEQTLIDADHRHERATLERLLADDFLALNSNGTMENKAEAIAWSVSADNKWTDAKLSNLRVRIYGDAAVVTGNLMLTGSAKGYVSGPRLITDVWVRRDGRWQAVSEHVSLVVKQ